MFAAYCTRTMHYHQFHYNAYTYIKINKAIEFQYYMMNTVYTSHDEFFAANMIASLSNKGTNITAQESYKLQAIINMLNSYYSTCYM